MELAEFLQQTQAEVRAEISDRMGLGNEGFPYQESVFAEVVMDHMANVGMTFEPVVCHFERTVGNANLRLSGYAIAEDADQLDLFVCIYDGVDEVGSITDTETKTAAEQCLHLLSRSVDGRLSKHLESSDEAYAFVETVKDIYAGLDQIRIYVLTDRVAKTKNFKAREIAGKSVRLEVMDIERLHRHWSEGKPRDEIVVDFTQVCGGPLPCVYFKSDATEYEYALTALPAEALNFIYDKYGARLLEANVRSFLSAAGKVNRGIRDTLKGSPNRFIAFNNGIVLVADELKLGHCEDGSPGIAWMKGLQIVNGGQTTASIYFTKKKEADIDFSGVRVAAKIIVIKGLSSENEESLIADISRFSNSQNSVKLSDLSANKPFHVELERLSNTVYCPDGVGRWFYERAAGSYHVLLAREGTTPARLRALKAAIPSARRINKTDLAKYLNTWEQLPHVVSMGAQKNFERFMARISSLEEGDSENLPDTLVYKSMIAKAILFRRAQALIRPMFQAFQANITTYTLAVLVSKSGSRINCLRIWDRQDISKELTDHIKRLAHEVHAILNSSAGGRMISEWAKKPECWDAVLSTNYSNPAINIPELQ